MGSQVAPVALPLLMPPPSPLPPPPRGEVGDEGKELGGLGVARREGGREGLIGYDKTLNNVVLLDDGLC